MRRRIRSAAFPLHRHSLPQLAVDGALVALAYYLAFQLRFNSGPPQNYASCARRRSGGSLGGSLPLLVLSRVYQRRWRYAGQRDYEAVVRAVVLIVLLTVGASRSSARFTVYPEGHPTSPSVCPNGVVVLYGLLALVFLVGVRAIARTIYERRPLAGFRSGAQGRAHGAYRGRRRRRPAWSCGRSCATASSACCPWASSTTTPLKLRLRIDGVRVRGNTERATCRGSSTTPSPTK